MGTFMASTNKTKMNKQAEVTIMDSVSFSPDKKNILIGKVIAGKKVSWGNITGVLRWSWSEFGKVKISSLGDNLFMFEFANHLMANCALSEGPWSIDGFWLNLKQWHSLKA